LKEVAWGRYRRWTLGSKKSSNRQRGSMFQKRVNRKRLPLKMKNAEGKHR
jgi:hypothetical protein